MKWISLGVAVVLLLVIALVLSRREAEVTDAEAAAGSPTTVVGASDDCPEREADLVLITYGRQPLSNLTADQIREAVWDCRGRPAGTTPATMAPAG